MTNTRFYNAKHGYVTLEKTFPAGYYLVILRHEDENKSDKILCDEYEDAKDYVKSFRKIANQK